MVNRFLINNVLCSGLFVGCHYALGSRIDSEFWRYARGQAWPQHRDVVHPDAAGCDALRKFDGMFELMNRAHTNQADWHRRCGFPLTSYAQMAQGLGFH